MANNAYKRSAFSSAFQWRGGRDGGNATSFNGLILPVAACLTYARFFCLCVSKNELHAFMKTLGMRRYCLLWKNLFLLLFRRGVGENGGGK
jgi:hypothetical protein